MNLTQAAALTDQDSWFRFWMPYAFVRLEHPRLKYVFLPVNRNYKPLGYTGHEHLEYASCLPKAIAFKRDPSRLGVWASKTPHLFLYKDGERTRLDYFERLECVLAGGRLVEAIDALAKGKSS